MFVLTLHYANGTDFIVGGFNSQDTVDAWLVAEQAKPSWVQGTTWTVQDNSVKG